MSAPTGPAREGLSWFDAEGTPSKPGLETCIHCGLCLTACPEPYGLMPLPSSDFEIQDPASLFGKKPAPLERPVPIPDERLSLPETRPLVTKGTYASSIGALLAGCRHFFGYPITPSTEGAELMAKLLPQLDGVFVQAVSEVATVNMMYGCGGAGLRAMTFTSSGNAASMAFRNNAPLSAVSCSLTTNGQSEQAEPALLQSARRA